MSNLLDRENFERLDLEIESIGILSHVRDNYPNLFKYEAKYQNLRLRFSRAYFSGSELNFGDCFVDYIINNTNAIRIIFGLLWMVN